LQKENETFIDSSDDMIEEVSQNYCMEVIVFKLADKEYSFEVDSVDEIIDAVSSTSVAFTDDSIEGIINIRGQIVTTLSLYKKLNIEHNLNENSKLIICHIDGNKIGFVVDSVSDILNIKEEECIEADDGFFKNVLHLDNGNRLVLSMEVHRILEKEDIDG